MDLELLSKYKTGLIALSAGLNGEIARTIVQKGEKEAKTKAQKYLDVFGREHFYLEIQNHKLPLEKNIIEVSKNLSRSLKIDLVATNDVHYIEPNDAYANEILQAIADKATIHTPKGSGKGQRKPCPGPGFTSAPNKTCLSSLAIPRKPLTTP